MGVTPDVPESTPQSASTSNPAMSRPVNPTVLPLDEAMLALEGAAAALLKAPSLRAVLTRHADFWRFRTGAVPELRAWDAVFPLAALTPNGCHLLALLVEAAARSPGLEAVVVQAVVVQADVGNVFVAVARLFERSLPVADLRAEQARREVVLRVLARVCGAAIAVAGAVETPKQSDQVAQRLDVTALNTQEKALRRQMRLMEAARAANAVIATGSDLGA